MISLFIFHLIAMLCACAKSLQSYPTLCSFGFSFSTHMNPLKSSRADGRGRGLFVQSNQANFNFKCRRQARFSSPPLCSYDGLTTVELVRFPGKDSTNAGLSSLLINRPPVLKSSTCCFKSRVKAPQKAEYISLCSFI